MVMICRISAQYSRPVVGCKQCWALPGPAKALRYRAMAGPRPVAHSKGNARHRLGEAWPRRGGAVRF